MITIMEGSGTNINPDHYKNQCSIECIEAMQLAFGPIAVLNFCICNAFKYLWRHKNKNGMEDLDKAKWYVTKGNNIVDDMSVDAYTGKYEVQLKLLAEMINDYYI